MFSRRDIIKKLGIGGLISSLPVVTLAKSNSTVQSTINSFNPVDPIINMQIPTKRKDVSVLNRMIAQNDPLISAFLNYYVSNLKNKKGSQFITESAMQWIAREYLIIGDVFPFISLYCEKCKILQCNCNAKVVNGFHILNPDWIDVKMNPLDPSKPVISLIPDASFKQIVLNKDPAETYNALPDYVKEQVSLGKPILLSSKSVTHIKKTNSPYHPYGISFLAPLHYTMVAYYSGKVSKEEKDKDICDLFGLRYDEGNNLLVSDIARNNMAEIAEVVNRYLDLKKEYLYENEDYISVA